MIGLFQGVLPLEFESTLSVVVEQKFAPSNVDRSDKLLNLHWPCRNRQRYGREDLV